ARSSAGDKANTGGALTSGASEGGAIVALLSPVRIGTAAPAPRGAALRSSLRRGSIAATTSARSSAGDEANTGGALTSGASEGGSIVADLTRVLKGKAAPPPGGAALRPTPRTGWNEATTRP